MKKNFLWLLFIFFINTSTAKAQWIARQNLGTTNKRTYATSFSLNGKIYIVGGQLNGAPLSDLWVYDIATDVWTKKNDFPGGARGGASAFTIGNKAYLTGGSDYNGTYFSDTWEYDDTNDSWIQKNSFPGMAREEAFSFVIGSKAYVGTGFFKLTAPGSTTVFTLNDFWEYNSLTDLWAMKAFMPGLPRAWALGAAVGNKGYAGLGGDPGQTTSFNDFYEYDPLLNTWTTKPSYPGTVSNVMSFALGGEVYVCGGINFATNSGTSALNKFDPSSNNWNSLPAFAGGVRIGGVAAVANNRVFMGTGHQPVLVAKQDWWEFAATNTLCPAQISFNTFVFPASGVNSCDGKIVLSGIKNGCGPYIIGLSPTTNSVLNGNAITYTVSDLCAGNYTVYVGDNCCGPSSKTFTISSTTGMMAYQKNKYSPLVFPNPNSGVFKMVVTDDQGFDKNKLRILDLVGNEIDFSCTYRKACVEIALSNAVKGIYFLRYGSDTSTQKIVIEESD